MNIATSLLVGWIFGLGLLVSGMADPAKVLGFLDLAGRWDPSLGVVMAGAVGVGAIAFSAAKHRTTSLLGQPMRMPSHQQIDRRLVGGSLLFGIGWGLAGFCPGPGLVAVGMGETKALAFVVAMLAGMGLHEFASRRGPSPGTAELPPGP